MQPNKITLSILLSVIFTLGVYSLFAQEAPKGWILDGNRWDSYSTGIDSSDAHGGKFSAFIKSEKTKIKGFGTLMQASKAEQYHGKRVRFSAYVKTKGVED